MHAAPSIIIFTVLSGAGFGLLVFLGMRGDPPQGLVAFVLFAIAYGLAVSGLVASVFHLANPQRAWRAFSQWRTSWLSREGWVSVAALLVMAPHAAWLVFFGQPLPVLGWIGAALALGVLFATSMIYAQLATVPRWNTALTPAYFVTCGLACGALLAGQAGPSLALLALLGAVQLLCWWRGDRRLAARGHDLASATGLGFLGRLRLFEPPHTGSNFLLHEFVHQVGRRHRPKLRAIAFAALCPVPLVLVGLWPATAGFALAFLSCMLGCFVSRWLFFAEAEHVVGLYYDAIRGPAR
ncbi:DmsC/YnfH family molybdoenzyme membrane anchor subunit [uncultured Paracoccus sp.]|uniref:dimethyl sulfoxide reductase anchor subunit family protein n=1 Tax=uncultured Paracoccus sp. TaxID=189685 RepID=UPI0025E68933|nr:DmsC/YnfH family molybdoenzyme membrane anchor subunit [uncultured Paracoccus sp.]